MVFKKSKGADAPAFNDACWVTEMNGIIEVKSMSHAPTGLMGITKLDKEHYLVHATGEVRTYNQSENRADNTASLKKTFANMRHILNANFTGSANELFVTLTYAENMTDTAQLYRDFKAFMNRFRRRYPDCEYFIVVEPQARGAWHCHVLFKWISLDTVYIPNEEMSSLWGHGYTTTRRLAAVDNIGAYLTAYLADIKVPADTPLSGCVVAKTVSDEQGNRKEKRFLKGGRLHFYPSGMNLYRHSRGIRKPDTVCMSWDTVKKEVVGDATPNYSTTVEILDDEKQTLVNTVRYYQFNLKRIKSQAEHETPVPSAQVKVEGTNYHDDSTGNTGIPNRTADTGEHPQNNSVLPDFPRTLYEVCEGWQCPF